MSNRLRTAIGRRLAAAFTAVLAVASAGAAGPPRVVADIAPVQSLAAQVMDGVGVPGLLLRSSGSPHDYSMKPSEARMLAGADVVVWTGPILTPWLQDALATLAPGAEQVTFSALDGLILLPFRGEVQFDVNADGDADGHDDAPGHLHGQGVDPHIWLDPHNAAILVTELARVLSQRDPGNAARYRENARLALDGLAALEAELAARVAPLRSRPYLVFHDAYQYFGARFGISAVGAVAVSDGVKPGAQRIRALQRLIAERGVVCVFAEPQFDPELLHRLTEEADIRSGVLDPIGAGIAPGAQHYNQTLRAMADGLSDCLQP